MADGKRPFRSPVGCNSAQRFQHEAPLRCLRMGYRQPPRAKPASAPKHEIEINDAGSPASPAPPAKIPFDPFEAPKHFVGLETALHKGDGVGEVPAGAAARGIEDDRGSVENVEILIKPRYRSFDYGRRTPVASVRPVGPDRDRV
jgi:hypothetical protein